MDCYLNTSVIGDGVGILKTSSQRPGRKISILSFVIIVKG